MFYDNFNKLCTKKGTSPTAFTRDVLGLSTSKVTAWKGGSIPKYEILQQIADAFNVTVGELFDGNDEENKKAPDLPVRSASEWDAVLSKLSDDSLIQLRDYLKYLVWKQDQADLNTE